MDRGQLDISLISSVSLNKDARRAAKVLDKVDKDIFRKVVNLSMDYLQGKTIQREEYEKLKLSYHSEKLDFDDLFSGLLALLRGSLRVRSKLKPDIYKHILMDEYHMTADCADYLQNLVFGSNYQHIHRQLVNLAPSLPRCQKLSWKIDVIISSNFISKIMEPVIVFEVTNEKGQKTKFEATLAKFNKLRFAVAYVLKEMNRLEDKQILKS